MECINITTALQYLIIGGVYATMKQYIFWDYHKHRSWWTRWHHYWTEACFWPIDFVINTIKLLVHNKSN